VPPEVTAATWRRILDPGEQVGAILAASGRATVGFANYVLHPYTWGERPICLLEDLYVDPHARGTGVGARLIEHLVDRGREEDWARVYWHTRTDNAAARRLYDRFGPADGFIRYTIPLHGPTATREI
jgi:GNAT superfamily N-acetyltransferase